MRVFVSDKDGMAFGSVITEDDTSMTVRFDMGGDTMVIKKNIALICESTHRGLPILDVFVQNHEVSLI